MGSKPDDHDLSCWTPFWKNGAYRYDFRVEGLRYRRSTGVCCKKAFKIACEVAEGVYLAAWERANSPYPTLAESFDVYRVQIGKNEPQIERLRRYFGPYIRVDEITEFDKEKCVVALARSG